ncbi:hypothetical protein vseg_005110 [Gypsophila vaccaria]
MQENSEEVENSRERRENELKKVEAEESKKEGGKKEEGKKEAVNAEFYRNLGGNRWPEQETMALLEIRSNLDVLFRDSAAKSPLWEEVSRRMAELGYHRSAKKCREKFENIYKYNKRLKTASARPIGKTYRFFNQLEALDHHQISLQSLSPEQSGTTMKGTSIAATPISSNPPYVPHMAIPLSVNFDASTPSSSGSESESTRKRKRKWTNLFDKLMKSVLEKQEELQNKFFEALDKCEKERLAREEAWKTQEIELIKKHHELLMQERSVSAAKDAAVLAFLQKISEQGKFPEILGKMEENLGQELSIECRKERDDGENSSSRWPKEEVEALIRIKTSMESQYDRIGPLWEDISVAMKSIGYDRNAKKCKEKWENINKYYRRVKDNNKQRPVDSKTCPYFHLLDSLYYGMKSKRLSNLENSGSSLKPEELLIHMMKNNHSRQQQPHQAEFHMNANPSQNGNNNSKKEAEASREDDSDDSSQ